MDETNARIAQLEDRCDRHMRLIVRLNARSEVQGALLQVIAQTHDLSALRANWPDAEKTISTSFSAESPLGFAAMYQDALQAELVHMRHVLEMPDRVRHGQ